jgi:hypothetical protein
MNRPPSRSEQFAYSDGQRGHCGDKANQPQKMAITASDRLVESTVDLLESRACKCRKQMLGLA